MYVLIPEKETAKVRKEMGDGLAEEQVLIRLPDLWGQEAWGREALTTKGKATKNKYQTDSPDSSAGRDEDEEGT